jgi:aryl-alcohol dehydrogenase-like predicted oxidoreductase
LGHFFSFLLQLAAQVSIISAIHFFNKSVIRVKFFFPRESRRDRISSKKRSLPLKYRVLGRTNIRVSEIGYGCWAIGGGWGKLDDQEAVSSIHQAIDLGVNFLDTALAYGEGHSEKILSKALGKISAPVTVATKIPPKNWVWPAKGGTDIQEVFPKKWIIESTEKSLKNLNADCLDLQQFHVWTDSWMEKDEWKETIALLKKQGKIRFFGVSINDHEPESALKVVQSGLADTVQVIYNIFDQSPEKELFPLCSEKNTGIIARVPLDEGGLSGKLTPETKFDSNDWRSDYFKGVNLAETCRRADQLKFLVRDEIKNLAQGALKFCLSNPAVSTVITGMRKAGHVQENCDVSDGKFLKEQELAELKHHAWRRNFYHPD